MKMILFVLSLTAAASSFGMSSPAAPDARAALVGDEPAHIQPGLVRWHADVAAACAAARQSGRPVLLFQLLGRLDQEFC